MLPSIFSSRWSVRRPARMGRYHADPAQAAAHARERRNNETGIGLRCVWTCCCGRQTKPECQDSSATQ